MDLGATVCGSRAPACDACPVATVCRSRGHIVTTPRRPEVAFAKSTRRLRGIALREIASARDGVSRGRVVSLLDDARATDVLADLARDGLIERAGRRLRLPA